jgi:hypothetical protein
MPYYRKKPVVIEARQLEYTEQSRNELARWCNGYTYNHSPSLTVGDYYAQVGDYIIENENGDFSVVGKDKFEKTYEPIADKTTKQDL